MDLLMNRFVTRRIVLIFSMLTLFFVSAHSQTTDDGGDGSGTPSTQTIQDLLQNSNITPANQGTIKSYIQGNNTTVNGTTVGTDLNQQKTPSNQSQTQGLLAPVKDTAAINAPIKESGPNDTYGADIFSNASVTNISELSTPPLDYPIGVGDHIIVALWGGGEDQQDYVVARDGSIFPAGLGKIIVQGLTFDEARSLIYSRFRSIVPATTNIAVTLGQPRTINVNVGGEVMSPGPLTVSAFSNAFNVIGLAGGVTKYGNLRAIQVKRDGKVIEVLDVYKYLTTGDIGDHIYLQNNDFILVTFFDKKVQAIGFFKRPMYYQLKKDEGLRALMQYTGGFTSNAYTSSLKIIRNEDERQQIHNVSATALIRDTTEDYLLHDGDMVEADSIKMGIINKVQLTGAVTYPGVYEFKKGDRLFDIIRRAGGILRNTYMQRVYVFRGGADSTSIKTDRLDLDISRIDSANSENDKSNVLLKANDLIQLFTVNEFVDVPYVDIFGEVRKPGHVLKYGGMTLQDLLYLSDGLKPSAQYGRLEISRVMDIDSAERGYTPTRTVVLSFAISPDLALDTIASKVILQPFDQIFVRTNPTYLVQQNVQILGLVNYPGFYPRLSPTEKLADYVDRAGGFKLNADLSGAVLFRQNVDLLRASIIRQNQPRRSFTDSLAKDSSVQTLRDPVSIDLEKAMKDRNARQNIVLQENDIIYVPEIDPFVTIKGSVQSPLRVTFDDDHTRLGYYIDAAGGFGIHPWRRRIFVTYANGKSRRTNNFAFFHFYPKVKRGATITVPNRPQGKEITDVLMQSVTALIPIIIGSIILKTI